MKTAVTVFIAAMVFSSLALPPLVNAGSWCHYLEVSIPGGYHFGSVSCSKGVVDIVGRDTATFRQADLAGPECVIVVDSDSIFKFSSLFHVHQDFCLLEAGNITLTHKLGSRQVYTIKKGSYKNNRSGKIEITAFDPP